MEYRHYDSRGQCKTPKSDCGTGHSRRGFRLPAPPSKKARRACPRTRNYPDNKMGHWILIAGVVVLFMFAPTWVWVIGIGAALILVGLQFMNKE